MDKGQYLKAINDGEYTYQRQTNITLNLYKVVGIMALFIVIYILFTSLRKSVKFYPIEDRKMDERQAKN